MTAGSEQSYQREQAVCKEYLEDARTVLSVRTLGNGNHMPRMNHHSSGGSRGYYGEARQTSRM